MSKKALCWDTQAVDRILDKGHNNMVIATAFDQLPTTLVDRSICETDESTLQILPYITLRCVTDNTTLLYTRPTSGGETRLHSMASIGFGGHVDEKPEDGVFIGVHLGREAARELQEELGITPDKLDVESIVTGCFEMGEFDIIRIKDTAVESVHLGLSFVIGIKDKSIIGDIQDNEIKNCRWVPDSELCAIVDGRHESLKAEHWSEFVFRNNTSD